jgi:hypothetical protein
MNTVKLYKNPYPYPYYGNISNYKTVSATPRNQDLRSGYIDMQLTMDEIFAFNYLSFNRDGRTIYAWVENIEELSGNKLYRVHYATDAFRTYRNDLVLGTQYIARSPEPTLLEDELLSSTKETNDFLRVDYTIGDPTKRYCIVQVRNDSESENDISNTPGQPTPYEIYACPYDVNNWGAAEPIRNLIVDLKNDAQSTNIVTIYSVPYVDLDAFISWPLFVKRPDGSSTRIEGWYEMKNHNWGSLQGCLTTFTDIGFPPNLTKTRHSVKLIFPDAGIMNIPDEFLYYENLCVRQDIDIFSGACNYMLCLDPMTPTHLSVRGTTLSTIPILSNPYDTYLSQNQNTLAVGLLGDVANLTVGAFTGNVPAAGAGAMGLINKYSSLADAQAMIPSNPPAFLGSALVSSFNQRFWAQIISKPYDNEAEVRARYGYPQHRIGKLTIPSSGFIQTNNCSVSSNGSVPLWAINEINQLFNAGILFK